MSDVTKSDLRAIENQIRHLQHKIDELETLIKRIYRAVQEIQTNQP
jgi:prefoldin subunit 5